VERRVLFLNDRYPPFYTGGYEIACKTTVDVLAQRGWKTLVLTSTFGVARPRRHSDVWRVLHRPEDAKSLVALGGWELADHVVLNSVLKYWKPHLVYAWCLRQLHPSLHLVLSRSGIPIVFNVADAWLPGHFASGRDRRRLWTADGNTGVKAAVKRAGIALAERMLPTFRYRLNVEEVGLPHVIACSLYQKDQYSRMGLPSADATVIYNGIDLKRFNGTPAALRDLRLLFSARLVPEKGAHTAVLALAKLVGGGVQNATLTIAGVRVFPWDYSDALRKIVADQGLQDRVTFLHDVPPEAMAELYRRHNVLVFPSRHVEGLPMTVLEAMASGLVVVGTTTGGTRELLRDRETGYVVPPDDPDSLASTLLLIAREPARAQALAAAGQQHVRATADLNVIADQTEAYLERVIASRA
jgi:glycosyltransferase involved in cell wall biosynthesis